MTNGQLPLDGGCRCSDVRLRISKPPPLTGKCHFTGCQRMAASAFLLSTGVLASGLKVSQGVPVFGGLRRAIFIAHGELP